MTDEPYRSATRSAYHVDEARASIAVAIDHLNRAEAADVDLEVASTVYKAARTNLHLVDFWCEGLVKSRRPDLDREAKQTA